MGVDWCTVETLLNLIWLTDLFGMYGAPLRRNRNVTSAIFIGTLNTMFTTPWALCVTISSTFSLLLNLLGYWSWIQTQSKLRKVICNLIQHMFDGFGFPPHLAYEDRALYDGNAKFP